MRSFLHYKHSRFGFTLVEVLVATCVFLIAVGGILYSYLKCLDLAEIGRNTSIAVQAVRNKTEDVKATPFANIMATFNNATFTANGINGKGVVYVNNSNPSLLQVKVVFCWKQQNARLIGEDKNLNGVLDAGEETTIYRPLNNQLDSYAQMVTNIFN